MKVINKIEADGFINDIIWSKDGLLAMLLKSDNCCELILHTANEINGMLLDYKKSKPVVIDLCSEVSTNEEKPSFYRIENALKKKTNTPKKRTSKQKSTFVKASKLNSETEHQPEKIDLHKQLLLELDASLEQLTSKDEE